MKGLKESRLRRRLSQRTLAEKAGVSFKGLQLMEQPGHNARLSSLRKVASALGLPGGGLDILLAHFLAQPRDSILALSLQITVDGFDSWPTHLFNFVDAFRASRDTSLIASAPFEGTDERIRCLATSTVETLCRETAVACPGWCAGIAALDRPWFVSGVESLKAVALAESPAVFRKRNIFVLDNFLDRA